MKMKIKYLLVTQIPFTTNAAGEPVVDRLWARDLIGLAESVGAVRVVAPEVPATAKFDTWGPDAMPIPIGCGVTFVGFPEIRSRLDWWKWPLIRSVLRREVKQADLVHSSNPFAPYIGLRYAHELAVKLGKKTLMVVAEDFVDMLRWEWVRTASGPWQRKQRERETRRLEKRVAAMVATASLSFLHTPAAVERFRLAAKNGVAIRQTLHDGEDVIGLEPLLRRAAQLEAGRPLRIASASRHSGLKGHDKLIQAIGLLRDRGIHVNLDLYGSGADTGLLQNLIDARQLNDRVRLAGTISPGRPLYNALAAFDLFAMVHRTTDFGRGFWDAMACGLPVIAFRTPAALDTVRDGEDGFITPLDDPQSLAEKLARLHENRRLVTEAAVNARRRALDNTRTEWFRMRAQWIGDLFYEGEAAGEAAVVTASVRPEAEAVAPVVAICR